MCDICPILNVPIWVMYNHICATYETCPSETLSCTKWQTIKMTDGDCCRLTFARVKQVLQVKLDMFIKKGY